MRARSRTPGREAAECENRNSSTIMVQNTGRWLPYFGAAITNISCRSFRKRQPSAVARRRVGSASSRPRRVAASNWCAMAASDRPVRSPNEDAGHAFFQAQRIEHELERQFARPDCPAFGHMAAIARHGALHPGIRIAQARLAFDAVVKRQLAMGAGLAQVVAELQ